MSCRLSCAIWACVALLAALPTHAQFYKQANLISDLSGMAGFQDLQLINPWGVSHSGTSPFWVSNAGTSLATIYSIDSAGTVNKNQLVVNVPVPSGQVFNGLATDFVVTSGTSRGSSAFLFAGLNGNIYGWSPGVPPPPPSHQAQLGAPGAPPAAYTGLALGLRSGVQFLYAANAAGNRIDVWDNTFAKVTLPFTDPNLPAGLVPFNIANINGDLYVTYSGSPGVINVFDTDGIFIKRFATGGTLLNPWGMAVAPADFGNFGGALLVGNFNFGAPNVGPGNISAFSLAPGADNGKFLGLLLGTDGKPLSIDGLWSLILGNGQSAGDPSVLYFSAGIQSQTHGLFGSLSTCHGPVISGASADPNVLWPPNNQFVRVIVGYFHEKAADVNAGNGRSSKHWLIAD